MIERQISIAIENGLHARPAAELVKKLNQFKSTVFFYDGEKKINPKSVLSMMTASIKQGQTIRVTVDGIDEEETMNWLINNL
ncbi:HPr family phosphocarrier protein [Bacillus methanolicus]|uniref:HPr family phosphocarrier protein n=1 Tax=Bacillus methanolicus TaxID=1471 RepID=UPI00200E96F7|nr:HPr family phosphocarrier protein [Bacillus methanolicus]UQD51478.1 HPr family phosphocarrier protein [Bacillus methanolicus]